MLKYKIIPKYSFQITPKKLNNLAINFCLKIFTIYLKVVHI